MRLRHILMYLCISEGRIHMYIYYEEWVFQGLSLLHTKVEHPTIDQTDNHKNHQRGSPSCYTNSVIKNKTLSTMPQISMNLNLNWVLLSLVELSRADFGWIDCGWLFVKLSKVELGLDKWSHSLYLILVLIALFV